MSDEDFYAILGVSRKADAKEIRTAYRKLAMQYHPDKNASEEAHEQFVKVSEAYSVLSNPEQRAIYDQYGKSGLQNGGSMTPEEAAALFWTFFRPRGYERGENPSKSHGAYVAGVGALTAPIKGAVVGAGLAGAGLTVGAFMGGKGMVDGALDTGRGVRSVVRREPYQEGEPTAREYFVGGIVKPVAGIVGGAATGVAGVVGGVTLGIAGGLGGTYTNVKEGGEEFFQAVTTHKTLPKKTRVPAAQNRPPLYLKDISDSGRALWKEGFQSTS